VAIEDGGSDRLRGQCESAVPAQDAGAVASAQIPQHHPAQVEAMRGCRLSLLAIALGRVDACLGLLQEAIVGPVEAHIVGEALRLKGEEALVIGILLPGGERRLLRHQRGEEAQPAALAIEDLQRYDTQPWFCA